MLKEAVRTRGWGRRTEQGRREVILRGGREGSGLSPGAALEQEPQTEWVPPHLEAGAGGELAVLVSH